MSNTDRELIAELKIVLTSQRYSPVVVGNYCAYARGFVDHLARRNIPVADVTEEQVAQYLHHAIALFRKRAAECSTSRRDSRRALSEQFRPTLAVLDRSRRHLH